METAESERKTLKRRRRSIPSEHKFPTIDEARAAFPLYRIRGNFDHRDRTYKYNPTSELRKRRPRTNDYLVVRREIQTAVSRVLRNMLTDEQAKTMHDIKHQRMSLQFPDAHLQFDVSLFPNDKESAADRAVRSFLDATYATLPPPTPPPTPSDSAAPIPSPIAPMSPISPPHLLGWPDMGLVPVPC